MTNHAVILRRHINHARHDGQTAVVAELEALLPAADGKWWDLDFKIQERITAINAEVDSLFQKATQQSPEFQAAVRQLDALRGALEGLSFALPT